VTPVSRVIRGARDEVDHPLPLLQRREWLCDAAVARHRRIVRVQRESHVRFHRYRYHCFQKVSQAAPTSARRSLRPVWGVVSDPLHARRQSRDTSLRRVRVVYLSLLHFAVRRSCTRLPGCLAVPRCGSIPAHSRYHDRNRRRESERPVAIPILISDFLVAELNQTGSAAATEPAKNDRLAMEELRMTYFRRLFYRSRQTNTVHAVDVFSG
jgi:hypothetical protein